MANAHEQRIELELRKEAKWYGMEKSNMPRIEVVEAFLDNAYKKAYKQDLGFRRYEIFESRAAKSKAALTDCLAEMNFDDFWIDALYVSQSILCDFYYDITVDGAGIEVYADHGHYVVGWPKNYKRYPVVLFKSELDTAVAIAAWMNGHKREIHAWGF